MKKIIYLLLAVVLCSCNSFLDKDPESDYGAIGFYNSTAAIKQGTTGVYQSLYMEAGAVPFCIQYDMFTPMGIVRGDNNSIGINSVNLLTNGTVESQWANFYIGVAKANSVLEGSEPYLNNLDEEALRYLAEVKVLRVFHYHYLVLLFGDIPYFEKQLLKQSKNRQQDNLGKKLYKNYSLI